MQAFESPAPSSREPCSADAGGALQYLVSFDGAHATIELFGEIDAANVPAVRNLLDAVGAAQTRTIEVDAASVTFMSGAAVGALMGAASSCSARHGRLWLSHPGRRVLRLLEVLHATDLLTARSASAPLS